MKASKKAMLTALEAVKATGNTQLIEQLENNIAQMETLNAFTTPRAKRKYTEVQQPLVDYIESAWKQLKSDNNMKQVIAQLIGTEFTVDTKNGTITKKITNVRIYFDTANVKQPEVIAPVETAIPAPPVGVQPDEQTQVIPETAIPQPVQTA